MTLLRSPSVQESRCPGSTLVHLEYTIPTHGREKKGLQEMQHTLSLLTSMDPFALATASFGLVASSEKRRERMADGTTSKKRTRRTSMERTGNTCETENGVWITFDLPYSTGIRPPAIARYVGS